MTKKVTFKVEVETTDEFIPYLKQQLSSRIWGHSRPKVFVEVTKDNKYFETIEIDAFERGELDL